MNLMLILKEMNLTKQPFLQLLLQLLCISFVFAEPSADALLFFEGIVHEDKVYLKWQFEEKSQIKKFKIERSVGNGSYVTLGSTAKGQFSEMMGSYYFTDFKPFPGINLYRLIVVNSDLTETVFDEVSVVNHQEGLLQMYPNPVVDGDLYLEIASAEDRLVEVLITDREGAIVLNERTFMHKGIYAMRLNLHNMLPGTYQLEILNLDKPINRSIYVTY